VPNTLQRGAKSAARLQLLRCAAATAHETATHQEGSTRELTFALMHMIDMARTLLEHRRAVQQGL